MKTVCLILVTGFFVGVFSLPASGAYRVHKLRVSKFDEKGKPVGTETVLSSLDHLQYEGYYGTRGQVRVQLIDTWYCPGDTSHQKFCDKPKVKSYRGLAGIEEPKRSAIPIGRQPVIP